MSDLIEDVDLDGYDAESVERPDGLPPGWYIACVDDVFKHQKLNALVLKFRVHAGDHEGQKIEELLWDPSGAKDKDGAKKAKDRRVMVAKRLGLIPEQAWGNQARLDWSGAVGKVVAINVKPRKYKDKAGNDQEKNQIDYGGIFALSDERVPKEVRDLGGETGGAATTGGGGGGGGGPAQNNPQNNFDDL